jgi:hypothetical protein
VHIKAVDDVTQNAHPEGHIDRVSSNEFGAWPDARKPVTLARLRARDPAQSADWSTTVR